MGTVGSGAVWGRTRVPFPASLAAAAPSRAQQGPCLRFCFSQGRATTGDVRVHLFQTEVFWSSFGFTGKSCVPGRQVDAFSRTELRAPVRFTPPPPPRFSPVPFSRPRTPSRTPRDIYSFRLLSLLLAVSRTFLGFDGHPECR